MQVAARPFGVFIINSFYLIAVVYGIFIWIAIWRSAGKHQGSSFWAGAARLAVVLGVIVTVGQIMILFDPETYDETAFVEQTRLMNNSLPMMLDAYTRLESASITKTEYRYENTLIDRTVAEMNVPAFVSRMRVSLASNLCSTKDTRAALDLGVKFVYSYRDSVGDHISNVSFTVDDCRSDLWIDPNGEFAAIFPNAPERVNAESSQISAYSFQSTKRFANGAAVYSISITPIPATIRSNEVRVFFERRERGFCRIIWANRR